MKKNIKRTVKIMAYYSFWGLLFQGLIVNLLLAITPAEAQNLRDIRINIKVVDVTLAQAFQILEQKTDFKFSYSKEEISLNEKITLTAEDEPLYTVLEKLAKDYGLAFNRINDQIVVKKNENHTEPEIIVIENGSVKGYVTDVKTGEYLAGASVALRGTTLGAYTDTKGYYEINNVKQGKYTIAASYVGYSTTTKAIEITSERTTEINLALGQSVVNLDEVIVTGSVSDRSIKESANPITVIAPHELENRDLTNLSTVLQSVPGIVSSSTGDQENASSMGKAGSTGAYYLNIRGYSPTGTLSGSTKYIVDGVELYNWQTSNYIDASQIEKIEVSRGPMSSTLYGTGSSGGIVHIFTKKGTGDLKVNLRSMFTSKESKYQDANPLNQEYTLSVNGGKADFGYKAAVNYSIYPIRRYSLNNGIDEQDFDLSGGVNGAMGNIKMDLSAEYARSKVGMSNQDIWYRIGQDEGWATLPTKATIVSNTLKEVETQRISLNIRHAITDKIYQNLTIGSSNYVANDHYYTGGTISSTTYYLESVSNQSRKTVKYFANMIQPITSDFRVDITGGIEYMRAEYQSISGGYKNSYQENVSQTINTSYGGTKQLQASTTKAFFGEAVWGFWDALFLTTGLRGEKNDSYGDDLGWYTMPRVGITYIKSLGNITLKPRASWGKSTQAVSPAYKMARTTTSGSYTYIFLENASLKPQNQSGYEVGIDAFYSDYLSLGVTYYDQKITDLVQVITIAAETNTYTYQYQNLSEAFNKGVELSAKMLFAPFTIDLTYTYVSSKYGTGFPKSSSTPYLVDGGRVINVPSGSIFARLSYRIPALFSWCTKGGNITAEYVWRGSELAADYYSYYKTKYTTGSYPSSISYKEFDPFSRFNLRGDYAVIKNITLYFDIANLLNDQDYKGGSYTLKGRTISFGFNLTNF